MPFRQLPQSDAQRTKAFEEAQKKLDSLNPTDVPAISSDTIAALTAFLPTWLQEVDERESALGVQVIATTAEDAQQARVAQFISHFIQVFNLAVARGKYAAGDRKHYHLEANQEEVPKLTQESDLTHWGGNLIRGEAARIAAGGVPMQNPNIAAVEAEFNTWTALTEAQTNTKDTYEAEQKDVKNLRPDADSLILDIWDEVEFAFRREDAPNKRRKAREYGVVYVSRPGEEPEEGVLPAEV
jgi:hypothetical protein